MRFSQFAAVALVAGLATGSGVYASTVPDDTGASSGQEASGTLTVAMDRDPERIDPNFARHVAAETVAQALFDTLIMWNPSGEMVPGLASSYEFTDSKTLSFELRDGVTFHNGEPFNAEAVKFSVERVKDPEEGSHLAPSFETIEEVEVIDDHHVVFHLTEGTAPLLYAITRLAMVPPSYYEEVGGQAAFERAPVGTGPYTFVEYVSEDHTTLAATPDYWDGSPKGQPLAAEVILRVIPEATTRVSELVTGGAQIATLVPLDQRSVVTDAGMSALSYDDGRVAILIINTMDKGVTADAATGEDERAYQALTDVRVRQALNYAVDKETIIEFLLGGTATPLGQPFVPNGFGYNPENTPYPYEPERARELLAEAGYEDGFTVNIVAQEQLDRNVLAAIMDNFAEIGVQSNLEMIPGAVSNDRLLAGEFAHIQFSVWYPAETFLQFLVDCEGLISTYCNELIDALLEQERTTLDPEERNEVLWQITDILKEDAGFVFLWSSETTVGVNDAAIGGFVPHARGWVQLTDISVNN